MRAELAKSQQNIYSIIPSRFNSLSLLVRVLVCRRGGCSFGVTFHKHNIFSMSVPNLKFEHIDSLHIFDLKAQKKNINYKKFFNLPLSFEEQIADQIQADRAGLAHAPHPQTLFKVRRQGRVPLRKLEKLSHPRRHAEELGQTCSSEQLGAIIRKCDKLKGRLLTDKKLCRFEKDSSKCYDYLFELSNFNFQKYESD